jgi:hypothetical protein
MRSVQWRDLEKPRESVKGATMQQNNIEIRTVNDVGCVKPH